MGKQPRPVAVDLETFGIEGRPLYPPVPVGVGIKYPGKKGGYYAFGHPTGNNCTWGEALAALKEAWAWPDGVVCHNGKFDHDCIETHFGLERLPWEKQHETMFLLFLDDPHQRELGLKPSSERLLKMPPDERDEVGSWLVLNQPIPGIKISTSKQSPHFYGRYIAFAPGELVGKYCIGDVDRTEKLFNLLYAKTVKRGMLPAYDRERKLMPILLDMERQGVPVDLGRLAFDVDMYQGVHKTLTEWLHKKLRTSYLPDGKSPIDSGAKLVAALDAVGLVDTTLLGVTDNGGYATDKEALEAAVLDPQVLGTLKYRTQLGTCLKTFMQPWLATAQASGGFIYTNWNQVKGDVGTRTGRLSSTPNFQNIPKEFTPIFRHESPKDKTLPISPVKQLPPLPQVRGYIVPWSSTHVLIDRDYSQQELRILAHFEDGKLRDAYAEDQWLDVHDYVRLMVNQMLNKNFDRKPIKNTVFGLIYGMGIGKLALKSGTTVDVAKEVKNAILAVFPGLKAMYSEMKQLAQQHLPIHTWGSREYFCEEPQIVQGRTQTYDYKMLNVLVQGSAADCTKEALLNYWATKGSEAKVLLTVHDEILVSCPAKTMKEEMQKLRTAMESVKFDVPMLSEGKSSKSTWATLADYDKKGVVL